jgi:hypothetical protein
MAALLHVYVRNDVAGIRLLDSTASTSGDLLQAHGSPAPHWQPKPLILPRACKAWPSRTPLSLLRAREAAARSFRGSRPVRTAHHPDVFSRRAAQCVRSAAQRYAASGLADRNAGFIARWARPRAEFRYLFLRGDRSARQKHVGSQCCDYPLRARDGRSEESAFDRSAVRATEADSAGTTAR